MRTLLLPALTFTLALAPAGHTQETVPREEALKASFAAWVNLGLLENTPVTVDADLKSPSVLKSGEYGAMIIPETKLADVIRKAGPEASPLGLLRLKQLTPVIDEKPLPRSRTRASVIETGDQDITLSLFLLGIRKAAPDRLELVLYSSDRTPLRVIPLTKISAKQELPIELAAAKHGDNTGELMVNILGQYQAGITMTKQAAD